MPSGLERDQRAQEAERRRQQHRERHRPALVQRRQEQEHHDDRQAEHDRSSCCRPRSPACSGPTTRSRSPRAGLSRATSSSARMASPELAPGAGVPLNAAVRYRLKRCRKRAPVLGCQVVSVSSGTMPPSLLRTNRRRDVGDLLAEVGLGLHRDLVVAAEAREVVDLVAAEEGLQRGEHVVDRHAELLRLLAVDRTAGSSACWR